MSWTLTRVSLALVVLNTFSPLQFGHDDAAAQPARGAAKRGGTLNVVTHADAVSLDPMFSTGAADRHIFKALYDSLVTIDANMAIRPGLASSWEQLDPQTLVFKLQENVKFHDGTDFDAEAVKWNIERLQDKAAGSRRTSELATIDKVEVIDRYTVKFSLKAPAAPLLADLADRAGYVVSPAAAKKAGNKDFGLNPVGTGPFKFVEWKRDDHVTLERFAGYWRKGLPYLDRIIWRPIPDETVRATRLQAGDVDFIYQFHPKDLASLKSNPDVTVINETGTGFRNIYMNLTRRELEQPEVRKALSMAIDREGLHKGLFLGTGAVAYGPFPPTSWAHDPSFKPYGYDPEGAKSLLAQAGHPNGLKLDIYVPNITIFQQTAQVIRAQWDKIGVTGEIKTYETGALLDLMNKQEYPVIVWYWSGRIDPDGDTHRFFHSNGSYNKWIGYQSPEMDRLLDAGRSTYDQAERTRIYRQIQNILARDTPMIYYQFEPKLMAYRGRVKGFIFIPDGILRLESVWLDK